MLSPRWLQTRERLTMQGPSNFQGVAEEAFKDSSYSLPEESRTPNMRNLSVSWNTHLT